MVVDACENAVIVKGRRMPVGSGNVVREGTVEITIDAGKVNIQVGVRPDRAGERI